MILKNLLSILSLICVGGITKAYAEATDFSDCADGFNTSSTGECNDETSYCIKDGIIYGYKTEGQSSCAFKNPGVYAFYGSDSTYNKVVLGSNTNIESNDLMIYRCSEGTTVTFNCERTYGYVYINEKVYSVSYDNKTELQNDDVVVDCMDDDHVGKIINSEGVDNGKICLDYKMKISGDEHDVSDISISDSSINRIEHYIMVNEKNNIFTRTNKYEENIILEVGKHFIVLDKDGFNYYIYGNNENGSKNKVYSTVDEYCIDNTNYTEQAVFDSTKNVWTKEEVGCIVRPDGGSGCTQSGYYLASTEYGGVTVNEGTLFYCEVRNCDEGDESCTAGTTCNLEKSKKGYFKYAGKQDIYIKCYYDVNDREDQCHSIKVKKSENGYNCNDNGVIKGDIIRNSDSIDVLCITDYTNNIQTGIELINNKINNEYFVPYNIFYGGNLETYTMVRVEKESKSNNYSIIQSEPGKGYYYTEGNLNENLNENKNDSSGVVVGNIFRCDGNGSGINDCEMKNEIGYFRHNEYNKNDLFKYIKCTKNGDTVKCGIINIIELDSCNGIENGIIREHSENSDVQFLCINNDGNNIDKIEINNKKELFASTRSIFSEQNYAKITIDASVSDFVSIVLSDYGSQGGYYYTGGNGYEISTAINTTGRMFKCNNSNGLDCNIVNDKIGYFQFDSYLKRSVNKYIKCTLGSCEIIDVKENVASCDANGDIIHPGMFDSQGSYNILCLDVGSTIPKSIKLSGGSSVNEEFFVINKSIFEYNSSSDKEVKVTVKNNDEKINYIYISGTGNASGYYLTTLDEGLPKIINSGSGEVYKCNNANGVDCNLISNLGIGYYKFDNENDKYIKYKGDGENRKIVINVSEHSDCVNKEDNIVSNGDIIKKNNEYILCHDNTISGGIEINKSGKNYFAKNNGNFLIYGDNESIISDDGKYVIVKVSNNEDSVVLLNDGTQYGYYYTNSVTLQLIEAKPSPDSGESGIIYKCYESNGINCSVITTEIGYYKYDKEDKFIKCTSECEVINIIDNNSDCKNVSNGDIIKNSNGEITLCHDNSKENGVKIETDGNEYFINSSILLSNGSNLAKVKVSINNGISVLRSSTAGKDVANGYYLVYEGNGENLIKINDNDTGALFQCSESNGLNCSKSTFNIGYFEYKYRGKYIKCDGDSCVAVSADNEKSDCTKVANNGDIIKNDGVDVLCIDKTLAGGISLIGDNNGKKYFVPNDTVFLKSYNNDNGKYGRVEVKFDSGLISVQRIDGVGENYVYTTNNLLITIKKENSNLCSNGIIKEFKKVSDRNNYAIYVMNVMVKRGTGTDNEY